jgi:Raf kinase inhibitor-like YbhB/YbcL family protein
MIPEPGGGGSPAAPGAPMIPGRLDGDPMALTLTSTAFADGAEIPAVHTCEGANTSPPLSWSGAPAGTRSLALVVDDPDAPDPRAPTRTFVHWVLYGIPAASTGLRASVPAQDLPPGTRQGLNDRRTTGYVGPCPPIGSHRYFFKLYALDAELPELEPPTKGTLEQAMQGHVLEKVELVGTYRKKRG